MNKEKRARVRVIWAAILGVVVSLAGVPAATAGEVYGNVIETRPSRDGAVDWTAERVTAIGVGFPPQGVTDPARARVMADRAAYLIAVRNLLEVVKGIRIDATTTVKNYVVESDVIQAQVSGFVKGAQIIRRKEQPDGAVEIEVAVPLTGIEGLQEFFKGRAKIGAANLEEVQDPEAHTSLIIDARGTGVKPALFPTITDEQGAVIYSPETVDPAAVVQHGMVRYATVKEKIPMADGAAQTLSAVTGRKPLRIKGLSKGGATVTISLDDAKKVMRSPGKTADFLKQARVIILLDAQIAGIQQ